MKLVLTSLALVVYVLTRMCVVYVPLIILFYIIYYTIYVYRTICSFYNWNM